MRPSESAQLVQPATASFSAPSSARRTSALAALAATAPAAAPASAATAGAGAERRDDGELPAYRLGRTGRARGRLLAAHELLEVVLAAHAHVLVDRHGGECRPPPGGT